MHVCSDIPLGVSRIDPYEVTFCNNGKNTKSV